MIPLVPKQQPITYIVDSLSLVLRPRPRFYPVLGSERTQIDPSFCNANLTAVVRLRFSIVPLSRAFVLILPAAVSTVLPISSLAGHGSPPVSPGLSDVRRYSPGADSAELPLGISVVPQR